MTLTAPQPSIALEKLEVVTRTIPTDQPESDGTLEWRSTTIVIVHVHAAGQVGMGYTYADASAAALIRDRLADVLSGCDVADIPAAWAAMFQALRNEGRAGVSAMAISAVDCALWDLKARLFDLPLIALMGAARQAIPIYGSGGFTSYDDSRLAQQLASWAEQGLGMVKMKIGRDHTVDPHRVQVARRAIGDTISLFVDANGAYSRKQALEMAWLLASEFGVSWFEEPRPSSDLEGLRLIRDQGPPGMDIAAGEYGYNLHDFHHMLEAGAVDVLMADVTRCGGFTGFLKTAAVCEAHGLPLSAHCAPQLSAHACCAADAAIHLEYFHDHVRIERMLFDGVLQPRDGCLQPDRTRPGHGLTLKDEFWQ